MKKHRKISAVIIFMFVFSILLPRSIKVQAAVQGGDANVTVVQTKESKSSIGIKNSLVDVSIEKPLVVGNKIKISINAMNLSSEAQDVTLITGLYDKNNKLVVYNLADDKIQRGKNARLTSEVDVPTLEIYTLKVFVWDSIEGMNPLIEAIEYTVNGDAVKPINDIIEPTFHSISVSDNDVDLYDEVVIEVNAADDWELADEAELCYVSEVNGKVVEKEVTLNLEDGRYVGTISIDETYGIGNWKVSFITLQDESNNVSITYNSNIHKGLGVDLSAADINLKNNIMGPVFQNISVSSNSVNLADKVKLEVIAIGNSGLAEEANLCYVSEVKGKVVEKEVTLKLVDGKYVGELLIDETYGIGNWKVSFITLQDKADNVTVVYNSNVHKGLGIDLSAADISLNGDILQPIFQSISVNQNTVSLYDNVIVEVKAIDNATLAEEASLCYVSEVNGKVVEKEVTLKLEDGKYVGNLSIDESYGIGNWKVSFITLQDTSKNVTIIYNSKVHAGLGIDLSAADITLTEDIAGPIFEGIWLSSKTINLYDEISIELKATDNSELAEAANLCYVSEFNGKAVEKEVTLILKDGKYVGNLSIDETYGIGNWKVSFVTLQDKSNNVTVVYNSKVHAGLGVDLSAGDINLSADMLAPIFESISVVSDEIEDYFTIRVKASDDISGLAEEANVSYVHKYASGVAEQEIKLTLENGVYVGKIRSAEATWDVNFITLEDKANNVRVIYNSKLHNGLGQDLSGGKVFKAEDIVAPWLRNISVNTSNVKLYDNLVIKVEAFENISKLAKEANICLVSEQNGKTIEKEVSLNLIEETPGNEAGIGSNGVYEAQLSIDKDFGIGKWRISFITLQDINNNVKVYYNANVHEGLGENLSAADFTTDIEGLDLNLNSIKVSKSNARLGDRVYIVMDASSNVEVKESASLCYVLKTLNGVIEKEITLDLVEGKYVGSVDIDGSLSAGLLQISFITIEDINGNVIIRYNSNVHFVGTDLSIGDVNITN